MLKLSKKADYGLMAVNHLAQHYGEGSFCSRDIARFYHIPAGLLAKVLQRLAQSGLVESQQGVNGGYALAKPPERISALEVISSIDGPVQITSCHTTTRGECEQTLTCTVKEPLLKVNERIQNALGSLSIAEMNVQGSSVYVALMEQNENKFV